MLGQPLDRRNALGAGVAAGLGIGLSVMGASMAQAATSLNLDDPGVRFRSRMKTTGSLGEETVHRVSTGHVWMYNPDGHRFTPFCSLENYNVVEYSHGENGVIHSRGYETAIYMKFGTDEVMEEWTNPITGETVKVHHYAIGPMMGTRDPDTVDADAGAENEERVIIPQALNWQLVGDTVYMPTDSDVAYRNPLQPDAWPRASAGETFGWNSFIMFAVKLRDLEDDTVEQALAHNWYQENIRWQPWMLMGQTPGRLVARGYGKKLRWEDVPADRIKRMEQYVPGVLDRDNWTEFQNEFLWYLRTQKPQPPVDDRRAEG